MSGDEHDDSERKRSRLEGVIPDLLKRAVEIGVEKATEMPESLKQFVADRKIPKEVAQLLFTQIEDTKNGILRVVAGEVRTFLEQTNLAADMQKVLTSLQFEVNTTIRFTPNDAPRDANKTTEGETTESPLPKPQVKTDVFVSRANRAESKRRNKE